MSDFDSLNKNEGDAELQEFLMVEKQKAQVNAQVSFEVTPVNWIISFSSSDVFCRFTSSMRFAGTSV